MSFEFTSDRPVLDFLPTVAARGTADEEKLLTDDDLTDWIAEAGLVDDPVVPRPGELDHAKAVREAMYRVVGELLGEAPAERRDRDLVNAAAAQPMPRIRLGPDGVRRSGDVDAVLSVLARDCLELGRDDDGARLQRCDDETCTRIFVDRSRGHRRRWCGMRGCGDRAKAAAYRARKRNGSAEA